MNSPRTIDLENDELYNVADVAKRMKLSHATIARWAKDGFIPMRRVGKEYRILESDFNRWLGEKL